MRKLCIQPEKVGAWERQAALSGVAFFMVLAAVALITLPDSSAPNLRHWPGWATGATANYWLEQLITEVPWKQEHIELFGRSHLLPRLTCWMADPGCSYSYSKLENIIESWSPIVTTIRQQIITATGSPFNSLLLNYYRNGTDAMGWHADDEAELDPLAPIASLSLGASRTFRFKPKARSCDPGSQKTINIELNHGDLLIMDYPTQQHWLHAIPRRLRVKEARLNLTFRVVKNKKN